ncbi:MAG: murein L,D-transpeptidase [Hyphomonas sp.]|uniref:L,D-transpeptidase family protein n=1 Tax=Hyphomonas sp. TaxID=87 RepID=UPI0017F1C33F|nr:murein L,D-transpeptidase family protein [Hyphomonas sp.]MBA3068366.1 murein L,D-transpeptidase [Hyphomonas sp.]MBU4060767.1 murein L,D-transpeptidase [Alphaproteobacteria bacterium]MBU4164751.1 murein L,D-transpeptidase [Alphaproteobacteria bacterium]MBU4567376.1 murein L,D-transpeptidase [Alphaproteobacteria bacterium]
MRHKAGPRPNLLALLLVALTFLCLPALLAFADAGTLPASRRSDAAYESARPKLERDLQAEGLALGSPVFLRITKAPAELTVFVQKSDGVFQPFRTWPVCSVSGTLGPKKHEGDGQAPEGFYEIRPAQMNPSSTYHLSFNLGYPNAFDRANGYTGSFLMVHGACVSIGCFAMTDPVIDDIWTLMQAAYEEGQTSVDVHIFPFPMTDANLKAHAGDPNAAFWDGLAPAWTAFEETGQVPDVTVSGKSYQVRAAQ